MNLELKKAEEIFILIRLAKMSLTEIETLSDYQRELLVRWFVEEEKNKTH